MHVRPRDLRSCFDVPVRPREDARIERFLITDDSEERLVDLDAARDALQAWMDFMVD